MGISSTVADCIKAIINFYMTNESTDKSLMKFPNNPEGYELRILDDDDDECKPEMAFPELDLNKKIIEYNLDSLAFCEIP